MTDSTLPTRFRIPRSALGVSRWVVPRLLAWFAANARNLPWRRTRDPYAIWVSEIMLQQTQVRTVIPYWERWMRELPTIESLAKARTEKIHKLWEGLGYYTRVRNMQKAAKQVLAEHGGRFPDSVEAILKLPGIGRYTAGAIASIAFNQPAPILDGNVIRVLTRLHGIGEDPREAETNARLWKLAEELVTHASHITHHAPKPETRNPKPETPPPCSALNQSLMELGALICTPRTPNCEACPIAKSCVALRDDRIAELPKPRERVAATTRRFLAFVIEHNGRVLVQKRKAGVVNAHLWEFPNWEVSASASAATFASQFLQVKPVSLLKLCEINHSITRYRITTEAYRLNHEVKNGNSSTLAGVWRTRAQLDKLPFTSAHRQIAGRL